MRPRSGRPINVLKDSDSAELIARLLASIPAATFEMETLCRLAGIKASRDIPTAAVEVVQRPRLLINPDFAAKYCQRDEHLFLLVMHELWHIILAHTRLYPRVTMAHNIAFDAIINAGLARQFNRPEYRGFFEALNKADEFPGCLLRPPEGWPGQPKYLDVGPPGTREMIERLYPPNNFHRWSAPLYQELLDLLTDWVREKIEKGEAVVTPTLLGDHSEETQDGAALDDPFMKDVMQRVSSSWPPPPFAKIGSRGEGVSMQDLVIKSAASTEAARRVFAQVLQRAVGRRYGRAHRKSRMMIPGMSGISVMPNARDRMASARQSLGVQGMLWGQPGLVRARMPEMPAKTYVYLDVSGSMNQILPPLLGLLTPYVVRGQAVAYQFSTKVEPLSAADLRVGKLRTANGTSINALLNHVLTSKPAIKRALIVTDGHVGKPALDLMRQIEQRGIRLYVVLPAESAHQDDLRGLARSIVVLPSMKGALPKPKFPFPR